MDAIVKLKDRNNSIVIAFYVRANQSVRVNVPEGHYQFQYATGADYSNSCDQYLTNMQASKDPNFTPYLVEHRLNGTAYAVQSYTLKRVAHGNFTPGSMNNTDFK